MRSIGIESKHAVVHGRDIHDVVVGSADRDAGHIERLSVNLPVHGKSADLSKSRSSLICGVETGLLQIGAGLVGVVIHVQHIHLREREAATLSASRASRARGLECLQLQLCYGEIGYSTVHSASRSASRTFPSNCLHNRTQKLRLLTISCSLIESGRFGDRTFWLLTSLARSIESLRLDALSQTVDGLELFPQCAPAGPAAAHSGRPTTLARELRELPRTRHPRPPPRPRARASE